MPRRLPQPSDDVTVYLVLNDHGQFGIAYEETDPAEADRETIIRNFLAKRAIFERASSGRLQHGRGLVPGRV